MAFLYRFECCNSSTKYGNVYVCWGFRYYLCFLQMYDWILELFRQCGIFRIVPTVWYFFNFIFVINLRSKRFICQIRTYIFILDFVLSIILRSKITVHFLSLIFILLFWMYNLWHMIIHGISLGWKGRI